MAAGLPVYDYTLTLPQLSDGAETTSTFQFELSWIGPLRIDSPPNSLPPNCCTPLGSPIPPTYYWDEITFTSDPTITDPEVILNYTDGSGDTVTFTMIEPDSFWGTLGTQAFPPRSNLRTWSYLGCGRQLYAMRELLGADQRRHPGARHLRGA